MAGHVWPVWLRFKGGKGVATMAGVLFAMNWLAALIGVAVFGVVFLLARYVSVASMVGALSMPVAGYFTGERFRERWTEPWIVTIFFALAAALVVVRHRSNIRNILDKKETRVRFGRKREAEKTS